MEGMVAQGHRAACLCMAGVGRWPGLSWSCNEEGPYKRYTVFNSGIYPALYSQGGVGTRRPLRDVRARTALRRVVLSIVHAERPDVVSLQSLFGLPFDLADDIEDEGIPVVFTAHDYFALCPTAHLFLPAEQPCRLQNAELTCHHCCQHSPSYRAFWLAHHLNRLAARFDSRPLFRTGIWRLRNLFQRLDAWTSWRASANAYLARRKAAIKFLKRLDVLHCISRRQARVFRDLCGPLAKIHVLPLTPPTIERIAPVPRLPDGQSGLSFVALNVNGPYKGAGLLENAFRKLAGAQAKYQLHVYGNVAPGPDLPAVTYHGRYRSADLDSIAAQADFCIVPSAWDETLGFAGLEMLARGVPLIASSRAGVADFIRDGQNGFVFDPGAGDALSAAVERALDLHCPVRRGCLPAPETPLITFGEHVQEMANLLGEACQSCQEPKEVVYK